MTLLNERHALAVPLRFEGVSNGFSQRPLWGYYTKACAIRSIV